MRNGEGLHYVRVTINSETIAGEDIEKVFCPEPGTIVWRVILKDGRMYQASGNVAVVTRTEQ